MKKKVLFGVCLLFGLLFLNGGLNKIFNYIPMPEVLPDDLQLMNAAMAQIVWLMPLIAVVEIVGGILIMIPRTRALGALVIFPVLCGIFLTHLFNLPSGLPMAIILVIIHSWILYESRAKYLPMMRKSEQANLN